MHDDDAFNQVNVDKTVFHNEVYLHPSIKQSVINTVVANKYANLQVLSKLYIYFEISFNKFVFILFSISFYGKFNTKQTQGNTYLICIYNFYLVLIV